ncbi:MAG: GxxExxY protein [Planctomycetota bacterium]|nr:GxxExxY protein [Planctomycetota bacterium]
MGLRVASPLPAETERLVALIIGAAIEVHRHLGPGFLESVYERALCRELELQGIRFRCQQETPVPYKGIDIGGQRLDMVVEEQVIVELKAVEAIAPIHEAQLISYLKATGLRVGLLINFNVRQLKDGLKRFVR